MSTTKSSTSMDMPSKNRIGKQTGFFSWLPRLDAEDNAERVRAALFYGGILVLVAAIMRLVGMAGENFWHDEITILNVSLGTWDDLTYQFSRGRPPVFPLIAYGWTSAFGTGEVISRLPSFIAGVLSVGVLFHLGSLMFNQRVGLLAAFIMTVTEFHIYYSQTFRYYSVYVLMVLLSFLFFYLLVTRKRWYYLLSYLVFSALAFYTHAHGIFAITSQGIFFLAMVVLQREWRNRNLILTWLLSQVLLVLLILPGLWLYFLADILPAPEILNSTGAVVVEEELDETPVGVNWLQEPSVGSIVRALVRFVAYEWFYLNPFGIGAALLILVGGIVLLVSYTGWRKWVQNIKQLPGDVLKSGRFPQWSLVLSWLIGMIMLPWVASFIVTPMFFDRYVLGASPAFYLFLALLVFGARRVVPILAPVLAFIAFLIPGLLVFYNQPDNEQWKEAANYVSANVEPDDVVVVLTSSIHRRQPLESFNWYYPDTVTCELHEDALGEPETVAALDECLAGYDRVWLVGLRWQGNYDRLAEDGLSGTLIEFFEDYDEGTWQLAEAWDGDPFYLLGVYLYEDTSEDTEVAALPIRSEVGAALLQ